MEADSMKQEGRGSRDGGGLLEEEWKNLVPKVDGNGTD